MADVGHELTNKELKKLERTLAKEYATAYKELQEKLDKQLRRFDVLDKQKIALLNKGKISQKEYDKWRNNQMLKSKWMSDMVKTSANDLVNVNKRASDIINGVLPSIYAENHNFGTCMAELMAKTDTAYTLYNSDAVAKLARMESIRLPKAKIDVPKDRRWNQQKMKSALTQGILQGESNKQIAKRLANITDMDRSSAIRNARTLTTGAENGGRLDSFFRARDKGIEMLKMWSATMDERTRDSHAFLDGVCVELEEEFPNGCMYPGDVGGPAEEVWNCRCALGSQLKGFERDVNHIVNGQQVTQEEYDEWKSAHGRFENIDGKWKKVKERNPNG